MTHYDDLSDYCYFLEYSFGEKNVGWLSRDSDFKKGHVGQEYVRNLEERCRYVVHRTRGLHVCELCNSESANYYQLGAERLVLGDAELRVFSSNGNAFACPNMVLHYIVEHEYLPPREFLEALVQGPMPSDRVYQEFLSEHQIELVSGVEIR